MIELLDLTGTFGLKARLKRERDTAITATIIARAQSLKLRIIAEGVEAEAQLAFLRQHGCFLIQGYFYSPARPLDEIKQLLLEDKRLTIPAKTF